MSRVVFSPHYDIGLLGIERLHPFDSRKYGRAWGCLEQHFGESLRELTLAPPRPVEREELLTVHDPDYLDRLRKSVNVAQALELGLLRFLPNRLLDRGVLQPMRWATMGTVMATEACLEHEFVVNLGGGYHHAKPNSGEGFCVYSDIAIAVRMLRAKGCLSENHCVAYIDLDAHQGNGVCHSFLNDSRLKIFDMFNADVYPKNDETARRRIDCAIPLRRRCDDQEYLDTLKSKLPAFLESLSDQPVGLAIYNAGTDIFENDPLGQLRVTAEGVLQRDLFVVNELRSRSVPTTMLLSGGYTRQSFQLVADSVIRLLT